MNSQTRKAHLKLLGPAPAGMKWVVVKLGEHILRGDWRCNPVYDICFQTSADKAPCRYPSEMWPDTYYWRLVPKTPKPTYFDALATFRRIMGRKLEDLDRDQADAIVADFIGHHCRKEDFVAYVKAAKKGLKV